MANPNPKIENLTRAGKGRPKKGLKTVRVALSPELLDRLTAASIPLGCPRNYLIEQICRGFLDLPADYKAWELAEKINSELEVKDCRN
jgi:hypothetical protein